MKRVHPDNIQVHIQFDHVSDGWKTLSQAPRMIHLPCFVCDKCKQKLTYEEMERGEVAGNDEIYLHVACMDTILIN